MTSKPFDQLVIMRDRVMNNKPIKDVHKLFQHQTFWLTACKTLRFSEQDVCRVFNQLQPMLRKPVQLNELSPIQTIILSETCLYLINQIFGVKEKFIESQKNLHPLCLLFNQQYDHVSWVITIEMINYSRSELNHCFKKIIDDSRFGNILAQVLNNIYHQDHLRYQEIFGYVYLSLRILPTLNQKTSSHNFQLTVDKNKLYFGFRSRKPQVNALYQHLKDKINTECDCYFTHFSTPLLFKGYSIKRDRKTRRICIEVPQQMLIKKSAMFQYGDFHNQIPKPRGELIHKSVATIYLIYQTELHDITSAYRYADNYRSLSKFVYFIHLSLLKTIALKQGCTIKQANQLLKHRNLNRFVLPKRNPI